MVDFCFLFFSLVSLSGLSKKVAKEINICGGQEDWVLPQSVLLECSVTVARHCQKQDNAKTCTSIFKLAESQDGWLRLSERSRATLKEWNDYQTGSDVSYNVSFIILCSVHCNSQNLGALRPSGFQAGFGGSTYGQSKYDDLLFLAEESVVCSE